MELGTCPEFQNEYSEIDEFLEEGGINVLKDFGIIGIFLLGGGLAFTMIMLMTNWVLRPRRKHGESADENAGSTFECGLDTQGQTWIQFRINYFLYALIFVVFDIETVFLYPLGCKIQFSWRFCIY